MQSIKGRKKVILRALKIAVGSSAAIYIAARLNLNYEVSAGTITLLTIVSTKWDTLKLSLFRVITLALTLCISWLVFAHVPNEWVAYGVFIFLLVTISDFLGWGATISVNAVIAAHMLTAMEFGADFIVNEIMLVAIGIVIAVVLNLFHGNKGSERAIVGNMRSTEQRLKELLGDMAAYLIEPEASRSIWGDIRSFEEDIRGYIVEACEYQDNTFSSHPGYYIDYFEMRLQQCAVLHNLHYEMKKIRYMPAQADVVAGFILYLSNFITEMNPPHKQLEMLNRLVENMRGQPLPKTREEFESRAILYHILMDLEDFLVFKKRFIEAVDEKQRKIYWNENKKESISE